MVKSETRRDAEILVRNPSPRLFGKKFRDSKKVNTNHAKTRLRDLSKTLPRFRDPAKIFRDPRFSRYHSPPLTFLKKVISFFSFLGSYWGECYVSRHLWWGIMTMQISGFLENIDWSNPDALTLMISSCIDWVVFLSSGVCLDWGWSERSREIWGSHSSNGKAKNDA